MPRSDSALVPTPTGIAAVALGGGLGTLLRALGLGSALALDPALAPVATLLENLAGAGALGFLSGLFVARGRGSPYLRLLFTTGLLGSFTTFSTLALDVLVLSPAWALLYLAVSLLGGLGLALAGLRAGRRLGGGQSG